MSSFRRFAIVSLAAVLITATIAGSAQATPPAYLLLRRAESPGRHLRPGHPDAAMYDVRTGGYAYGWFGASPRRHASRHFGYHRTYTQWSTW
jgi:hypothetical protein